MKDNIEQMEEFIENLRGLSRYVETICQSQDGSCYKLATLLAKMFPVDIYIVFDHAQKPIHAVVKADNGKYYDISGEYNIEKDKDRDAIYGVHINKLSHEDKKEVESWAFDKSAILVKQCMYCGGIERLNTKNKED